MVALPVVVMLVAAPLAAMTLMAARLVVVLMTVAFPMVEGVVVIVAMLMAVPVFTFPGVIKLIQLQILLLSLWMGWHGQSAGMVSTLLLLKEVHLALVNTLQSASITSGILGVHVHESVRFSGRPQKIAGTNCMKYAGGV